MNRTERLSHDVSSEAAIALGRSPSDKGTDRLAKAIVLHDAPPIVIEPRCSDEAFDRIMRTRNYPDLLRRAVDLAIAECDIKRERDAIRGLNAIIGNIQSVESVVDMASIGPLERETDQERFDSIDGGFGPTEGIGPDGGAE